MTASNTTLNRWVIDANYLETDALHQWLARRRGNIAVLSHPTMIELHKRDAVRTIQLALRICCQYPRQVLVLRNTQELIALTGRSKGLINRLINHTETGQFGEYCRTVIDVGPTSDIKAHIAPLETQAVALLDSLTKSAANLMIRLAQADDIFTPIERRELRSALSRKRPMSGPLQRRTCLMALDLTQELTQAAGLPPIVVPARFSELVNRLAFRYASMIVGYYIVRKDKDGPWLSNPERQLNQLVDLKIAGIASYFDGLKTNEPDLQATFGVGQSLIRALGGYTFCGRG